MSTQQRRTMEWFTGTQGFLQLNDTLTDNFTLFNALSFGAERIKGSTVTRMIIDMILQAESVAQTVTFDWGIVTMNADARAAGAFPDPEDVSDRAGWMVRGRMRTIQSSLSDGSQWARLNLDLRSQRVLHTEETELQLIVHNSSGGAFALKWAPYIRVLMKMPW